MEFHQINDPAAEQPDGRELDLIGQELRSKVPAHTIGGIDRYVNQRIEPGGFLRAVLENNLSEAMGRADIENRESLFDIVSYIYNECPATCWGNPEKVALWLGEIEPERP